MAVNNININFDLNGLVQLFNQIAERISRVTGPEILLIILALIMPPLAVVIRVGLTTQFWINLILTILGVVPGQIHALWVILFM